MSNLTFAPVIHVDARSDREQVAAIAFAAPPRAASDVPPTPAGECARSTRIADRYVISEIEGATPVGAREHRCYDIRVMLDPREHSPEFIDMAREHLAYAEARGLIATDPTAPHLVRIVAPLD